MLAVHLEMLILLFLLQLEQWNKDAENMAGLCHVKGKNKEQLFWSKHQSKKIKCESTQKEDISKKKN